jgi:hypothetical protein
MILTPDLAGQLVSLILIVANSTSFRVQSEGSLKLGIKRVSS